MNRRQAASLIAVFLVATGLACFLATGIGAEPSPAAVHVASATATPVTALPTPVSATASADDFGNTGAYIVLGFVLGALAVVAGVLVVLWFVID